MLKIVLLLLSLSTASYAQQVQWREIPSPSPDITRRGLQVIDDRIFVQTKGLDGIFKIFMSYDVGTTWTSVSFPPEVSSIDKIVRLSDTSFAVIGKDQGYPGGLYRSDRTGTAWHKYELQEGNVYPIYLLNDLPPFDDGPSVILGFALYDISEDSVALEPREMFYRVDSWMNVYAAEDQIIYYAGSTTFEDPMRPDEHFEVLTNNQGRGFTGQRPDVSGFDELSARGSFGFFFSPKRAVGVGYPVERSITLPAQDTISDVTVSYTTKPFLATTSGVLSTSTNSLQPWTEVGNIPGSPIAVAMIHDTSIIACSDGKLFITNSDVTSTVESDDPLRSVAVSYASTTREISINREGCRYSLELVNAVTGSTALSCKDRSERIVPIPREVTKGVYFYRFVTDGYSSIGKLLVL